jgi:hypothetical protein
MPLFKATIKATRIINGVRLEQGMSVEFQSAHNAPLTTNGGQDVINAFLRLGIDLKKANAVGSNYVEVVRV